MKKELNSPRGAPASHDPPAGQHAGLGPMSSALDGAGHRQAGWHGCACVPRCMHSYVCTHVCAYVCECACMLLCMLRACVCSCVCVWMYIVCLCTCVCMHVHMCASVCAHVAIGFRLLSKVYFLLFSFLFTCSVFFILRYFSHWLQLLTTNLMKHLLR